MDAQPKLDIVDLDTDSQAMILFAGYDGKHREELQDQFRRIVRQAELQATKITPEMIEAGVVEVRRQRDFGQDCDDDEYVNKILKAALGVKT